MADNYLEKRYEEVFGAGAAKKSPVRHGTPSLNTLLVKNRTVRRYKQDARVTAEQLRSIVEVNTKIASAMNRQALRYRLVTGDNVPPLREILFREPARSESATAFIVVYTAIPEDRYIDIDLGISLQSMALKATELGLNCLIKGNIDRELIRNFFHDEANEPLAVLCIGKAAESVFLKPAEGDSPDLTPYTKDGVHYVPKLRLDDILI